MHAAGLWGRRPANAPAQHSAARGNNGTRRGDGSMVVVALVPGRICTTRTHVRPPACLHNTAHYSATGLGDAHHTSSRLQHPGEAVLRRGINCAAHIHCKQATVYVLCLRCTPAHSSTRQLYIAVLCPCRAATRNNRGSAAARIRLQAIDEPAAACGTPIAVAACGNTLHQLHVSHHTSRQNIPTTAAPHSPNPKPK